MFYSSRHRNAFTLVELLVVIAILAILASMLAIALAGAQRQARETRAEGIIDRLNLTVLSIYEQANDRIVAVPRPSNPNYLVNAQSVLMWKRDWLRCSLPDRKQDLLDNPAPVQLPHPLVTPMRYLDTGGSPFLGTPSLFSLRGRKLASYRSRVLRIYQALNPASPPANWNAAAALWTEENQSAECLYLVLATSVINGDAALRTMQARDIGDTDGDGMPEILDPWGVPVGFMRWPVGFYLKQEWVPEPLPSPPAPPPPPPSDPELFELKQQLGRDSIDIVYSDPRYSDGTDFRHLDPFDVLPMVVSAGGDGVFDLYGLEPDGTGNLPSISYGTNTITDSLELPIAIRGYTSPLPFVDPYLFGVSVSEQLGARRDTVERRVNNTSDNVYSSLSFQ